ncbi:MAG TPA: M20/M25/M40 family metallo-hydrolase, partial [Chryseosolibacter sp.]|nr:M20/M25/M40 family metallo-hydrolase [Chryseosolibacter sp.]
MNTTTYTWHDLRVNADRMQAAFDELAQIGATIDGGVNRPTFSEDHLAARQWFRQLAEKAGLEFRTDGAGNHSAFLACGKENVPTLLLGSHLDSVPTGGRFDGALGVMAAFEVLRTVKDMGMDLNVNLEAIDFTDEEGTLVGLMGSAALAGHLSPDHVQTPRGGRENLVAGMARAGLSEDGLFS